ncbi:MAG: hypothetical protein MK105_02830 [Crocinitomicaceae bacterium]|nr:hypothetical protein [Crocinitomicaceae bacterium]
MKNTMLLILLLTASSSIVFGQTKKDVIAQQTKTIDSLNLESSKLTKLNGEISKELIEIKKEVQKLEESNNSKELLISSKTNEISILKDQILSINELIAQLESKIISKDKEIVELKNSIVTKNTEVVTLEDSNEINFEGTVELESMYDGVFFIRVKIDKGKLAGKTENLYLRSGMDDANTIDYTGNADFDGSGNLEGRKIAGVIIRSIGIFENYESGEEDSKEIYRLKDANYK